MINRIGLLAVDSSFPNLALMKISTYYKSLGYEVEFYNPFNEYDIVFMSKIFSFTEEYSYYITNTRNIIKGGTGYDLHEKLDTTLSLFSLIIAYIQYFLMSLMDSLPEVVLINVNGVLFPKKKGILLLIWMWMI